MFTSVDDPVDVAHEAITVRLTSGFVAAHELMVAWEFKTFVKWVRHLEKLTRQVRAMRVAINLVASMRILG